jgi:hypothetical protein
MRVLGVDPDLHNAGIAIVEHDHSARHSFVLCLHVVQVDAKLKGDRAVLAMIAALPDRGDPDREFDPSTIRVLLPGEARRVNHAVVEGQESYRGKATERATPDVLIRLAHVAGAAAREYGAEIVPPKVWKGSIPKEVKQARIMSRLGWNYEVRAGWVIPTDQSVLDRFAHIKGKQWSHVIDAIGLALWKTDQLTS